MGKRYYILIGILAVLFILVNVGSSTTTVNWHPTYRKKDKNPYGAEVTYAFLEDIYGDNNIMINRSSPFTYLDGNLENDMNVIYVAERINTEEHDRDAIIEFAERGNNILLISHEFSGYLADTLGIGTWGLQHYYNSGASLTLSFTN